MAYLMIIANSTNAGQTLYDIFKRRHEELLVSKFGSRAYLVKNNGLALELAYRKKLRDNFGVDIFVVEPVHNRDVPEEVKKNAEWHVNHPNALPHQREEAVKNNEIVNPERLKECLPKIKFSRT